ncbi:Uncharacterised protein [Shigella sonnei]|nr:Uncharacterised protein [Shigella sonnei]
MRLWLQSVGTQNTSTLKIINGAVPKSKNGRNFPQRVFTLSTTRPAKTSAKASNTRTSNSMVPAAAAPTPATSV